MGFVFTVMPAAKGSKNAQKGDAVASSFLHVRVTPRDKAGWVKAAQASGLKLAEWVVKTLNNGAGGQVP